MKSLSITRVRSLRRGSCNDFTISGKPLLPIIERSGYDLLPRLGGDLVPLDMELRARLLCDVAGDTPSGRVALYICPECGDFGCGVVSAKVTKDGDRVEWSAFGYENDHDGAFVPIERLGPFRFEWSEYAETLNSC